MKAQFSTSLVLALISCSLAARSLPSYFPICKRNDPKLDECTLKASEEVRPYLIKGVPELGLASFVGFVVPEASLEQGSQALKFKATLKDLKIYGLEGYKFNKLTLNPKELKGHFDIDLPRLFINTKYIAEGNILTVPLQGDGILTANITNSHVLVDIDWKIVQKKGVEYLRTVKTHTSLNVGQVVNYNIDGLFRDNETLEKAVQRVIKDNLNDLVEEMKPLIENIVASIVGDIVSKAINSIPYDQILPL